MQKKILGLSFIVGLLVIWSIIPVLAANKISVNPGIIKPGEKVTITLTLDVPTNGGTLNVTHKPSGTSWIISIPAFGPGFQSWTFPDDWPAGANTNELGDYDVVADMDITPDPEPETFRVEFFVIPELLFGSVAATIASFAAVIGFMKFKNHKIRK